MAGWTKMPHDMEVGLGPDDFVFDGDPAPPEKRHRPPHPIFVFSTFWITRTLVNMDVFGQSAEVRVNEVLLYTGM